MIDTLVRYLRSQNVPFRLASYPSVEPLPAVAHPIPKGGLLVEARVVLIDAIPTIAVMLPEAKVSFAAIATELSALAVDGSVSDLPPPFNKATEPLPPLGGALGVTTLVDQTVEKNAVILVFRAFSIHDYVELSYDDFELIERPRVASFAIVGELEPGTARVGA